MIRQRMRAGLQIIKDKPARGGNVVSKAGNVRGKLQVGLVPSPIKSSAHAESIGIGKAAREFDRRVGTVHRQGGEL